MPTLYFITNEYLGVISKVAFYVESVTKSGQNNVRGEGGVKNRSNKRYVIVEQPISTTTESVTFCYIYVGFVCLLGNIKYEDFSKWYRDVSQNCSRLL